MLTLLATLALAAPTVEDADAAYAAEDWAAAEKAYGKLAKKAKTDGRLHYRHAWSAHQLGDFETAAEAYALALTNGAPAAITHYNRACALAQTVDQDAAIAALQAAVAAGFARPEAIRADEELAALREDARFEAAVVQADRQARPCMYDPRYRAFDFWVGSWDVFSQGGQKVGTNEISLLDGGCTVLERWTGGFGTTGTSLNRFHAGSGVWMQDWMGQGAWTIHYEGGVEEGVMRFTGTSHTLAEGETEVRAAYTPQEDGSVVQHLEEKDAETGEWSTTFYGIYRRQAD
ncbi:MAG: hypothetical protein EP330_18290 [Deltaproteobacteria bacterium]|nr:MAG: hypothetical protein EP330_18290 [Deltaproteobacteria bacterium]